ncbi:uncharacterized protein LOC143373880 [Andrena cerasifolii]|uniref:uncharacterized protein LOC143373880 n=1 Tax=Andrena cerasifolii TaxID=2819439 RepID=UPI0040376690
MAVCPAGQSASNMFRRTLAALQLCGLLAACGCVVIRRDAYPGPSISIDCSRHGNSTACGTSSAQGIRSTSGQTALRVARQVEGGSFGSGGDVDEVTSRKKKDKGYGKLLLYFLGAGKVTMLYVMMNAVAAIAGKALIVAKVALTIATAIALKKAFEHKDKVSYEIIKHPYHSYDNTHSSSIDFDSHGGFGENDVAYRKRRRMYQ